MIKQIAPHETWPIRHQVMWPDQGFEYVKLSEDSNGIHFGLEIDNQLISVLSLFINDEEAQFRKFATLDRYQGHGFGTQLLEFTLAHCQSKGINRIWCNARVDKCFFYERFGLVQTKVTFSKGGIDYIIMEKILSE